MKPKVIALLAFLLFLLSYIQSPFFESTRLHLEEWQQTITFPLFFVSIPITYITMFLYAINCDFASGSLDLLECHGLDPKIGYVLISLGFSLLLYFVLTKISNKTKRFSSR